MNHYIYEVKHKLIILFFYLFLIAGKLYFHIIGDLDQPILPVLRYSRPLPAQIRQQEQNSGDVFQVEHIVYKGTQSPKF